MPQPRRCKMTKVLIKSEPGKYDITITGHAEKVNDGDGNLLCAAVSMLSQTLLQCMMDLESRGEIEQHSKMGDGYLRIYCCYQPENMRVKGCLETIQTGFLLLQHSYPKNINVVGENKF